MATYESGRESTMLDYILDGHKTIEGRLNRDKFADYKIGDIIWLRRDVWGDDGQLHDGEARQAKVEIVGIRRYASFFEMMQTEDYKALVPTAASPQEAAEYYNQFYTIDQQTEHGVLAIEIALTDDSEEYS